MGRRRERPSGFRRPVGLQARRPAASEGSERCGGRCLRLVPFRSHAPFATLHRRAGTFAGREEPVMTKSLPRAAAALSLLLCPMVAAPQDDDAVVVTATRMPTRVSAVVSDVSVITREEIEQAGVSSLTEILQAQPGVEITQNGGLGTTSTVFLRGTNPTQVLVLIDGLRVGSATTGTTAFQDITPSQIERIEIVRGPMSSLYGADAIGGVIQIFNRAESGPVRPRASAGYGTYNTQQYKAGIRGSTGAP